MIRGNVIRLSYPKTSGVSIYGVPIEDYDIMNVQHEDGFLCVSMRTAEDPFARGLIGHENNNFLNISYKEDEVRIGTVNVRRIIRSNKATVMMFDDGTKTVSKAAENEPYDAEKGILMCIAKKWGINETKLLKMMKTMEDKTPKHEE